MNVVDNEIYKFKILNNVVPSVCNTWNFYGVYVNDYYDLIDTLELDSSSKSKNLQISALLDLEINGIEERDEISRKLCSYGSGIKVVINDNDFGIVKEDLANDLTYNTYFEEYGACKSVIGTENGLTISNGDCVLYAAEVGNYKHDIEQCLEHKLCDTVYDRYVSGIAHQSSLCKFFHLCLSFLIFLILIFSTYFCLESIYLFIKKISKKNAKFILF